jgi:hypothetical protein
MPPARRHAANGYETQTRDNGDAALTLLHGPEGARIDCVILDSQHNNNDWTGGGCPAGGDRHRGRPIARSAPLVPPAAMFPDALWLLDSAGDVRPLGEIEGELIRYAVSRYRGRMSEVARRLQVGRSTLYRKLEALGLHGGGADPGSEGVAGERQPRKIA